MSFALSSSKASTTLGEDQSPANFPKPSSDIVYINARLSCLTPQYVQIPIARFLREEAENQPTEFISDDKARFMVRSAINEAVKDILDTDTSGVYDDIVKISINEYLDMCIQGTTHLRGMYYEIKSQAEPLRVSVGYRCIANALVTRSIGKSATIFYFDFTKVVSHVDDREIFELYRGTLKDDGESSLSTPRCTFGGSPSVLSDLELVMITDEDDPKGTRILSSLERKLDSALKATKLTFLGASKMPRILMLWLRK